VPCDRNQLQPTRIENFWHFHPRELVPVGWSRLQFTDKTRTALTVKVLA